jgi:hypothetical protein
MRRLYAASDVRSYARCRRQWWYERRSAEFAALEPTVIARRMAALRRRYGAEAEGLPAYRLLADLAARDANLERGARVHRAHAARTLRPSGCLPVMGLLAGLLLLLFRLGRYI